MMRKKTITLFYVFLAGILSLHAQKEVSRIPKIEARKVIEKGIAYHDEGRYTEAIQQYDRINPNDTSYALALYEKILSLHSAQRYEEALAWIDILDSIGHNNEVQLTDLKGTILDETGRTEEALELYNAAVEKFPHVYLTWYNKGITLLSLKEYEAAEKALIQAIELYPLHVASHAGLAIVNMKTGRHSNALMAGLTGMFYSSNPTQNNEIIMKLEEAMQLKDVIDTRFKTSDTYRKAGGNFVEIDDIIQTGIALSDRYKLKFKVNAAITRQLQIFMDKFKYDPEDKGWYMQFYGPIFQYLKSNKATDAYIYVGLQYIDDYEIRQGVAKSTKQAEKIVAFIKTHVNKNYITFPYTFNGETRVYYKDYYDSGALYALYPCDFQVCENMNGMLFYFYPLGGIKEAIPIVNNMKEGVGSGFYSNGKKEYEINYKNDKYHGITKAYLENGVQWLEMEYKNGVADGYLKQWNVSGILAEESAKRNDKFEGPYVQYDAAGNIRESGVIKNDLAHGVLISYYPNGAVASKLNYIAGKAEGEAIYYFSSGMVKSKGLYKNDLQVGNWESYYSNGQLNIKASYTDKGSPNGNWEYYYRDGSLKTEETYGVSGKKTGKTTYYDVDGKKHYEYEFQESIVKMLTFFDKSGNIIEQRSESKGKLFFSFYSPSGVKLYDGALKEGEKTGPFIYYYPSGTILSQTTFKDDVMTGKYQRYGITGNLIEESYYNKGLADGYFMSYYGDGAIQSEGWMKEGQKSGAWKYYHPDSSLMGTEYYTNGDSDGRAASYGPNGKIFAENIQDAATLTGMAFYDSMGVKFNEQLLENGKGTIRKMNFNQFVFNESFYVAGIAHDSTVYYFSENKPEFSCTYLLGKRHGKAYWYDILGRKVSEVEFDNGSYEGPMYLYGDDGKVVVEKNYADNKLEGKYIQYHENGQPYIQKNYIDGEQEGYAYWYAPDGAVLIRLTYVDGYISGYSYQDKSGDYVPEIKVDKKTTLLSSFYKNGKKAVEVSMLNGGYHGTLNIYYQDGSLMETENFVHGSFEGAQKYYYPGGKLKEESFYRQDKNHGNFVKYHENGKLKQETNYWMGNKHGEENIYDKSGKRIIHVMYYMDVVQSHTP